MTELLVQVVPQYVMPHPSTVPDNTPGANKVVDIDVEVEAALIEVTISRR